MSKLSTFSRKFPSYHPRKGEDTGFVEGILNFLKIDYISEQYFELLQELNPEIPFRLIEKFVEELDRTPEFKVKSHTIRSGKRYMAGDLMKPVVWISRPYYPNYYNGKRIPSQLQFAPPIPIPKTWKFEIKDASYYLEGKHLALASDLIPVAHNDALCEDDFECWFKYPADFSGQIICWNKEIEY